MTVLIPNSFDNLKQIIDEANGKLVAIDFYATWCGPCSFMMPKFTKLATEFENVVFVKIDVDEMTSTAQYYQIEVMPTFILIKNGKQIECIQGRKFDELREAIDKNQ